ncbi:MAG: redoxin domain-containing protein [Nitrospira sp.]|nr:redoxin domain-containing protein [Nitrospira sp.]
MKQSRNGILLAGLLASVLLVTSGSLVWGMGSRVPAVGTTAEDFRLPDLAGKQQSLSQYRGKVVLVNFGPPGANPAQRKCRRCRQPMTISATRDSSCWPSMNWKMRRKYESTLHSMAIPSRCSWTTTTKWRISLESSACRSVCL